MNRTSSWMGAALMIAVVTVMAAAQDAEAPKALALGSPIAAGSVKMKGADGKSRTIAQVKGAKGTLAKKRG